MHRCVTRMWKKLTVKIIIPPVRIQCPKYFIHI